MSARSVCPTLIPQNALGAFDVRRNVLYAEELGALFDDEGICLIAFGQAHPRVLRGDGQLWNDFLFLVTEDERDVSERHLGIVGVFPDDFICECQRPLGASRLSQRVCKCHQVFRRTGEEFLFDGKDDRPHFAPAIKASQGFYAPKDCVDVRRTFFCQRPENPLGVSNFSRIE